MITPSSLHFERHHSGVPNIDPREHRLLIHGMVTNPLILTIEEIKRLPSVSHILFSRVFRKQRRGMGKTDRHKLSKDPTD